MRARTRKGKVKGRKRKPTQRPRIVIGDRAGPSFSPSLGSTNASLLRELLVEHGVITLSFSLVQFSVDTFAFAIRCLRRSWRRQLRKLLKKYGFVPERMITDKLRSYGAAKAQLGLSARHEQGLQKNNRAENSHLPVRRRERKIQRFKSPGSAQRFLSVHAVVHNTFNVQRHLVSRNSLRALRGEALQNWQAATTA